MTKKKPADEAARAEMANTESDNAVDVAPAQKKRASKVKKKNSAQVHEQIAGIVKAEAPEIAQALIERAKNGDTGAAKYLFELAEIFPVSEETNAEAKEEDSLAKTLMHRLNLPEEPIKMDEDEDGKADLVAANDSAVTVE